MSEIEFTCPKCKQSLEGDASMAGQVVDCPACNSPITVPAAPKKQIIVPKLRSAPPPLAYTPPAKRRAGKAGIVVALVVGLVIGFGAGSAKGPSGILKSGGITLLSFGRLTKEAWRERVAGHFDVAVNQVVLSKANPNGLASAEEFKKLVGKPDRTQTVGEQTYWYYTCSDGQIQMVTDAALLSRDIIAGAQINDY